MKRAHRKILLAAFCSLLTPSLGFALAPGQTDNFEDGTTQGWLVGLLGALHPAPPVNVPDGGPAGAGDNFLQLTAVGGAGAGNRMTAINVSQWTGNYLSAGVGAITMDLRNFGPSDLSMRLLFADPEGGPPVDVAISTEAVFLPAGGDWTSVSFPISLADLTALSGSAETALMKANEVRLFHNVDVNFPGTFIVASLGVDNITAIGIEAVPEAESTALLLGFALLGLALVRGRAIG